MKIIIDYRMRKIEKEYLSKFGELIEILPQKYVYEEICAHPDIFFCKVKGTLFEAPNLGMNIGVSGKQYLQSEYPNDIRYNICTFGNFAIHNFNYTDEYVLKFIDEQKISKINIRQGYSNCSISVVNEKACITSDLGIYKELKKIKIDCLYIEENNIHLINKNGVTSKMNGFIGGATCKIGNEFILFGDSKFLNNRNVLINFLNKYNVKFKDFNGLEILDYGGIIKI